MDERELLDKLRAGDRSAFDALFRAFYPQLVGFAESLLRDRAIAEDLAQDVMFELWRRRESPIGEQTLRGYLFQATRNRALNHVRHLKIEQRSETDLAIDEAVNPVALGLVVAGEIEVAIQSAVAELPPRCREVFELSRVHHLKYSEIAATLSISIKTVETQMGKALQLMRARLAPWLDDTSR